MGMWSAFFTSQIWQLAFLALCILGVAYAPSRRDMGKAGTYAAWGFGLLALASILGLLQGYVMMNLNFDRADGAENAGRIMKVAAAFAIPLRLTHLAGLGLVLAAVYAKRPPSRVE